MSKWKLEDDYIYTDINSFISLKDVTSVSHRVNYHSQIPVMAITVHGGEKEFEFMERTVHDKKFNEEVSQRVIELNKKKKVGRPAKQRKSK